MRRSVSLLVLTVFAATSAQAAVTVYDANRPGWESAVGSYDEEFFADATLNPGVSVTSDWGGFVDLVNGVWHDRLACPDEGGDMTTWHFATPIYGFGGTWNPGVPGGVGAGIAVSINGSWVPVEEIDPSYVNIFWGFVSDVPFTDVLLQTGAGCGSAIAETYQLDDLVYAALQNYVTGGGKIGTKRPAFTFGGSIGADGPVTGQFQIHDHVNGVSYHTTTITSLAFSGPPATSPMSAHSTATFTAEFSGSDGSTKTVTVTIRDLGEKRPKTDTITLSGDLILSETAIDGGNFQVHDLDAD